MASRAAAAACSVEESPGSAGMMPGNAWKVKALESAAEMIPPSSRVKWCGKSAPRRW